MQIVVLVRSSSLIARCRGALLLIFLAQALACVEPTTPTPAETSDGGSPPPISGPALAATCQTASNSSEDLGDGRVRLHGQCILRSERDVAQFNFWNVVEVDFLRVERGSLDVLVLDNLELVREDLWLRTLPTVTSIGAPALRRVVRELRIENNPSLTDLDFPALATIGAAFVVTGNSSLMPCEVSATFAEVETWSSLVQGNCTSCDGDGCIDCPCDAGLPGRN